mgnify:CR=1 FL=1
MSKNTQNDVLKQLVKIQEQIVELKEICDNKGFDYKALAIQAEIDVINAKQEEAENES